VIKRLAIIDDHALVREGMADAFAGCDDFSVVGMGGTAEDAFRIATQDKPDVIFLDVNMPGSGVTAAEHIRQHDPSILIVMFSFRQDAEIVRASLAAGATGYVVKGASGPDLVAVARTVVAGNVHIDPKLSQVWNLAQRS
jgi:DNA-binding NarL/FixJ family response regulator